MRLQNLILDWAKFSKSFMLQTKNVNKISISNLILRWTSDSQNLCLYNVKRETLCTVLCIAGIPIASSKNEMNGIAGYYKQINSGRMIEF